MTNKQLLGFFLFWLASTLLTLFWVKDDHPYESWLGVFLKILKGWGVVVLVVGLIAMLFYGLFLVFGIA